MRRLGLLIAVLCLPFSALAQDRAQTLADIKAELASLAAEFIALKQELIATGAAANGSAGADPLGRMDAMEAALARLTAKAEEIDLRLNAVVADGTNRIGDLEFRLCELTEGCDPASLPDPLALGAATDGSSAPVEGTADTGSVADAGAEIGADVGTDAGAVDPAATTGDQPEMAVNEQSDFDRAQVVLDSGDFRTAADLFATYAATYPAGELTQQALVLRGDALSQLGDTAQAARAYLDAFSGRPDAARAGEALTKLGQALGRLGQTPEACVTLAEVGKRFPGSPDAANAQVAMQGLGCQ